MSNWPRPYHQEYEQKPYLFYAAFADFGVEDIQYSGSLARGLDVRLIEADYFRSGFLWDQLCGHQPELAQEIAASRNAVVVQGDVESSLSLDYLHDVMEFLSYLVDLGACAIYDPQTLTWTGGKPFLRKVLEGQILNPFDHVVVLSSEEENGNQWLHTRGMIKFGRPDLSVHDVKPEEFDLCKKVFDRFINFLALGGVIEQGRPIALEGLNAELKPGPVRGGTDDPDFNNFYIELLRS